MFCFVQTFLDVGAKVSVVMLIWSPLYMNMDKNVVCHWGGSQTFFLRNFWVTDLWSSNAEDRTLRSWGKKYEQTAGISKTLLEDLFLCAYFNSVLHGSQPQLQPAELTFCTCIWSFFLRKEKNILLSYPSFIGIALQLFLGRV